MKKTNQPAWENQIQKIIENECVLSDKGFYLDEPGIKQILELLRSTIQAEKEALIKQIGIEVIGLNIKLKHSKYCDGSFCQEEYMYDVQDNLREEQKERLKELLK